jgi:hypothetical protein
VVSARSQLVFKHFRLSGLRDTLSVLSQIMKTAMRARALREYPAAGHSMPTRRQRAQL